MTENEDGTTLEGWLDSHARNVGSAKVSHALITPGLNLENALIKSTLRNQKQLNGLMLFLLKLEDRGMGLDAKPPLNAISKMIMRVLIGSGAIGGKNAFMAAEVDIGVIDQAAHQTYLTGKPAAGLTKARKGFLKKRDEEGKEGGTSD